MSKSKAQRSTDATRLMAALPSFRRAIEFEAACPDFGAVADRLGRIAAFRAELETYEKKLKDVVITLGEDAIEGKLFRSTLSIYDQTRLNSEAIREAMDEKWIAKYSTTTKITKVATKARTGAVADMAAA